MNKKQLAAEILRSLRLLEKRQAQESVMSTPIEKRHNLVDQEKIDEEQIWKEEMKTVEMCLAPVFRKLLPTPLYCVEEFCKDNENNHYWRPLTHTGFRHYELAMKKLAEQVIFNQDKEFRVSRYFRELEI